MNLQRAVVGAAGIPISACLGLDMEAIRIALRWRRSAAGSTITSARTVQNRFSGTAATWARKAPGGPSPPVDGELFWPKSRGLEVYLNVAKFGEGVFGAEAAARHHFRRSRPPD